jgi:TM2 domain-containing membrane protein YozV
MLERKEKKVATLLAFLVGGLGIHKFYLGQNVWGVVYLLLCGTFLPAFVSIFESFGLLLMSNDAFEKKYNLATVSTNNPGQNFQNDVQQASQALVELNNLYDRGLITLEEYEEKRRKLLE